MTRMAKTIFFSFEMKEGEEFNRYDTKVTVRYHYDDYGSDIDSNRGEKILVINEVQILGVLDSDAILLDPVPQNIRDFIESIVSEKI